jgi:transcription initiation factor TFIID subunit TAF12
VELQELAKLEQQQQQQQQQQQERCCQQQQKQECGSGCVLPDNSGACAVQGLLAHVSAVTLTALKLLADWLALCV